MTGRSEAAAPAERALGWRFTAFDALTPRELQAIYMARQKVFAIEQNCVYLDADGLDERAFHLAAWSSRQREPAAYARLLEPGAKYSEASIGRVLTVGIGRGCGLGRALMVRALEHAAATWPGVAVRIGAQTRLERVLCVARIRRDGSALSRGRDRPHRDAAAGRRARRFVEASSALIRGEKIQWPAFRRAPCTFPSVST